MTVFTSDSSRSNRYRIDPGEAEDIAQKTFIKLIGKIRGRKYRSYSALSETATAMRQKNSRTVSTPIPGRISTGRTQNSQAMSPWTYLRNGNPTLVPHHTGGACRRNGPLPNRRQNTGNRCTRCTRRWTSFPGSNATWSHSAFLRASPPMESRPGWANGTAPYGTGLTLLLLCRKRQID